MEVGIDSFAASNFEQGPEKAMASAEALGQLLERMEHADKVGLDVFGIGEQMQIYFFYAFVLRRCNEREQVIERCVDVRSRKQPRKINRATGIFCVSERVL